MFNLHIMLSRQRGVQTSLPTSDISNSGWSTAPLWSKLADTPNPDTSTFIQTSGGGHSGDFKVGMGALATPTRNDQTRIRVWLAYSGVDAPVAGTTGCFVTLWLGSTSIATFSYDASSVTTTYQEFVFNLSSAQSSSIGSGWTGLSIEVSYNPHGLGLDNTGLCAYLALETPAP